MRFSCDDFDDNRDVARESKRFFMHNTERRSSASIIFSTNLLVTIFYKNMLINILIAYNLSTQIIYAYIYIFRNNFCNIYRLN